MISQELMLGDWVMLNPGLKEYYPFAGRPCMVIGLHDDDGAIKIEYDNGKYFWTDAEDDVLPIPLTPEILEKNGFEYNDGNAKYYPNCWEKNGILLRKRTLNGFFYLVTSDYDDQDTNSTSIIITYVHELQHLLRLCGIEKTIEL